MEKSWVVRGDICYSKSLNELVTEQDSYLVCEDGVSVGVFKELPEKYENLRLYDYSGKLVMPGMSDLHVHAPQYAYRGLGMDLELLEWLDTITFPVEAEYQDLDFARKAYRVFVDDMKKSSTTRAVAFATIHVPATELLMDMFEESGLKCYVGKVNMDRNSKDYLCETAEESLAATEAWIESTKDRYRNVKPIITPRFIPSCSDELMRGLSELQKKTKIPVQSHVSENLGEIAWVKELCPWSDGYPDAYDKFGMFGGDCPTIMAHCVHLRDDEVELIADRGVFVAHCPQSNENIRSGIAPVRQLLSAGAKVGLASDVAGGAHLSLFRQITDAIQCSKLRWRILDDSREALSLDEAFFLATKGGGEFFGKVGSFEAGYECDVVVVDDSSLYSPLDFNVKQRLERAMYLLDSQSVTAKFVAGEKIL